MVFGRINEVVISTMFSDKKFTELLSGPKNWTKVRGGRVKVLSRGAVPLYPEDEFASYCNEVEEELGSVLHFM